MCYSMLQCVAARVAAERESLEISSRSKAVQSVAGSCGVLQYVAACCSVLRLSASLSRISSRSKAVQSVAGSCSMLQYVAYVLQRVAAECDSIENLVAE